MPDYDFHQLSPYDLEILARDLLQAHWGVTIESFKTGKDGGIDLRYATGANQVVVQVKHYVRTGLLGLLRDLGKEASKVHRLKPSRYLLITSIPLSAANKQAIIDLIGADVLKASDVFGQEDLNNLLGQHPMIEGQHYKLWLASRAVLDRVVHNAAVTRSEFKARQVHDDARRYVQSSAYPQALSVLSEQRVVIIAGPPGVGKSTLANLLLYQHLEKGFQAVLMQRDIDEGESVFQRGTQQVFYFDDFMGATFLGDRSTGTITGGANDRALLNFIAMVRETPTARLILTTREHIYSQAMDRSERLRNSDIDDFRVVLRMPNYSFAQKARILYNHIYFSDLPREYQDELLRDNFYLHIIKHEKFNPRLIEWLSNYRRLRAVTVSGYRNFVAHLLQDPSEIWRHAYEQEISDAGRSLLLTIFSLGGKAGGVLLKQAFSALHLERAARYRFQTRPEDFRSGLREIGGSFIKPFGEDGVEVIDPSVLDLLNSVVRTVPENAVDIIVGAATFDQIERVWSFARLGENSAVLDAIRSEAERVAGALRVLMVADRRIKLGEGAYGYRGATFERRLALVIEMSERLSISAFTDLVAPLFARLLEEWKTERPELKDSTELLKVLAGVQILSSDERTLMSDLIRKEILEEASTGCWSNELREVLSVVDSSDFVLKTARSGFEQYRSSYFSDELAECQTPEQFDALIETLEFFEEQLAVDVSRLVERVEEAKSEFEDHEENYADGMEDMWKEQRREAQASDRSVSDMFESLRGDRE